MSDDAQSPRTQQELPAEFLAALRSHFAQDQWVADPALLREYGRDESDYGEFPPQIALLAESTEQVAALFNLCCAFGVPVTPCGARSGKSGGSLPLNGGVSLSIERMNRIKSISIEDMVAVVQPGVITGAFMKAVEEKGLFYPPDPNSLEFCTLGGNIAENAGGPRALKYGVTRDYVIGLEWVLPDGSVLEVGRHTIKGVAGYDLVGLFVGSEGTLGVATEIVVQLIPLPKRVRTALVLFRNVHDAARAVSAVLAGGLLPRCLELFDELCIQAVSERGLHFQPSVGAAVLLEVDGSIDQALSEELEAVGAICEAHGATEILVAQDEEQRQRLWSARRVLSTALRAMKRFKVSDDIAIPRSRIAEAVGRFKGIGASLGLTVATYGHAGDGNLHANILFDSPSDRPKVDEAVERILAYTVSVGGTITGEHGVGIAKRRYLSMEQSDALISLQRSLKDFFDPSGILNPGKIFPPP